MEVEYGPEPDVAVRSSATAEDLPTASFAGRTLAESKHQWRQDPQRLPADAPNIVIFMSDDAGFITGSTISANGGQYMI